MKQIRNGTLAVVLLAALASCASHQSARTIASAPRFPSSPDMASKSRGQPEISESPTELTENSLVAAASGPTVDIYVSSAAQSPERRLINPNSDGAPLRFLVRSADSPRLSVYLPYRPNGATGWIDRSQVQLLSDPYRLEISIPRHSLKLFKAGRLQEMDPVGIGRGVTPTPAGTYYLTELLQPANPGGVYGPYAFGTSAFSTVLTDFGGGSGQIGLHGTNDPTALGRNVSHGCLRVSDDVITRFARALPLGTPVIID